MMAHSESDIRVYENAIPPFVESELVRLYAHLYSSVAQFAVYGDITGNISTYVARRTGVPHTILLLRHERDKVHVLNQQIDVGDAEMGQFARYIFATYPRVNTIHFHAVRTRLQRFAFPYQQLTISEDIVVALPDCSDKYVAALGKATRKNLKHHLSRLKRSIPELVHTVYERDEANEQQIRNIVALNHARMAGKNKLSYIDEAETERIVNLVKRCGLVSVMSRGGRVCAGVICYRIGDNYFSLVNGHDPDYNDYRLGTLCFYQTIIACIERGGKEFHFMWGQYEYKYMLLGVQRDLNDVVLYRSHAQLLRNGGQAMQIAFNARLRSVKFWLLQQAMSQRNRGVTARIAARALHVLKALRQMSSGVVSRRR